VSSYDATVAGFDPNPYAAETDSDDPVLDALRAPIASAMTELTANRLNWPVDGRYEALNSAVNRQWDWGRGRTAPEVLSDLGKALAADGRLRVLVAHGYTDLVTPYFASQLLLDQLPNYGAPERLRLTVYPGGHMFYARDDSRRAFHEDGRRLVEGK